MTEVKICGVCRPEDAAEAGGAGAAYVGVILAPGRRRTRTLAEAEAIFGATSARRVGVFVDAGVDEVRDAAERLRLDVVQLHGDEDPATVEALSRSLGCEVWKAVRVRGSEDVVSAASAYGSAHAVLLDGWSEHGHGGVGARFDWSAVAPACAALRDGTRLVVAGGLNAGNVAAAVAALQPDVVDVSSGVEAMPGRKSTERVRAFLDAARSVADGGGAGDGGGVKQMQSRRGGAAP